jgi:LPS export ABC transporter protein LptC
MVSETKNSKLKRYKKIKIKSSLKSRIPNPNNRLLWLIIIAVCCGIIGCSSKGDDTEHTLKENMPATTMKDFHLLETVNGKPQWELSGKNADIKPEAINLHGITCVFFHPQTEKAVLKVKADKGKLETDTKMIELVGEVVAEDVADRGAVSAKGSCSKSIFYSSRLIWDATSSVLISPEETTIQMNGVIFKADTLTINTETGVVEARGVRISVSRVVNGK